jgi:hypothetical protein
MSLRTSVAVALFSQIIAAYFGGVTKAHICWHLRASLTW